MDDGNDRISFTGERHGTAAPVNPEGVLSYTYPRLSRSVKTMLAVGDKLAAMNEESDGVAFAFIPDYYMTEYKYPASGRMNEIVENVEANRGPDAWEIPVRAMLLGTYRFSGVDVQNGALDRKETPVLVLASARYMDGALQQKIVDYVREGGNVLLYGEVPVFDMEGKPCTLLAEALGLRGEKQHRSIAELLPVGVRGRVGGAASGGTHAPRAIVRGAWRRGTAARGRHGRGVRLRYKGGQRAGRGDHGRVRVRYRVLQECAGEARCEGGAAA